MENALERRNAEEMHWGSGRGTVVEYKTLDKPGNRNCWDGSKGENNYVPGVVRSSQCAEDDTGLNKWERLHFDSRPM